MERCEYQRFSGGHSSRCFNRAAGSFSFSRDSRYGFREQFNKGEEYRFCGRCGNQAEKQGDGSYNRD